MNYSKENLDKIYTLLDVYLGSCRYRVSFIKCWRETNDLETCLDRFIKYPRVNIQGLKTLYPKGDSL